MNLKKILMFVLFSMIILTGCGTSNDSKKSSNNNSSLFNSSSSNSSSLIASVKILLNTSKNEIEIEEELKLSYELLPSDTNINNLTFTTSNPSVASVNNEGLVKGLSEGVTIITVSATINGISISDTLEIKVTCKKVNITSVEILNKVESLFQGETYIL